MKEAEGVEWPVSVSLDHRLQNEPCIFESYSLSIIHACVSGPESVKTFNFATSFFGVRFVAKRHILQQVSEGTCLLGRNTLVQLYNF